ncbi:MAG TPA: C40 family peptidase [Streptosporangiaceae bacterium]|nr:C40 family peptidase [Streptosporangiaceae bacterium]
MGKSRDPGGRSGTVRGALGGPRARPGLRLVVACALLGLLSLPVAVPAWRLDSNPKPSPRPPSTAQINAAENRVRQQEAALGTQQGRLSAAAAQLAALQAQAEVLTERYDQVLVDEQRAASAYKVTEASLKDAQQAETASQRQLAALAAQEFESGGGFDSMTAMLGDSSGPQGYLNEVGLGQVLAQRGTDILAASQANDVVAAVFRKQAHDLLVAEQADLRAASRLKLAIEAAVARQLAFVQASRVQRNKLAGQLAAARAHVAALQAARQAALAAAAAAAAAAASAAAGTGAGGPPQAPAWAWSSGATATQGDIAANWALTQLGKPYQWGAAGPYTYDCSGLTMEAWAHAGVQLLHYTGYQWEEGPHVPLDDLQRGDLLFYATDNSDPATIHHVGIYIGNGMMVDAPYTGAFVRIDSIYAPGYPIGAVRPAG